MERGILRTFKPDGTPVEVYDAEAVTKAEFTTFNTYSTDEVDTGKKWTDGKTIYRKVVDTGALPDTSTKTIAHNIENIDKIVQLYGTTYNASLTAPIPYPSTTVAATIILTCSKTSINITTGSNQTALTNSTIILHYTKTS